MEWLIKLGTIKKLNLDDSFIVTDTEKAWYVISGAVSLSCTALKKNSAYGRLSFFTDIPAGTCIFGMGALLENPMGMLLTVEKEAMIAEIEITAILKELSEYPEYQKAFSIAVEQWIQLICTPISLPLMQKLEQEKDLPDASKPLSQKIEAGGSYTVMPDTLLYTMEQPVWITANHPYRIRLAEKILLEDNSRPLLLPLSGSFFLVSENSFTCECLDTKTVLQHSNFLEGLRLLHTAVLKAEQDAILQEETADTQWLQNKYQSIDAEFFETMKNAKLVLDFNYKTYLKNSSRKNKDSFVNVCTLIAAQNHIQLENIPDLSQSQDPLGDLCRIAGINYREVKLEAQWHKKTEDALLGFTAENHQPVALIREKGKFWALNPDDGIRIQINKENESLLAHTGYRFYRPFPDTKLSLKDVLLFDTLPNVKNLLWIFFLGAMGALLSLTAPLLMRIIFDYIVPNVIKGQMLFISLALILSAVCLFLFELVKDFTLLNFQGKLGNNLQSALWARLLNHSISFFGKYSTGDLMIRAMGIASIKKILSEVLIVSLLSTLFAFINFFLLFLYNVPLAMFSLLIVILHVFVSILFCRKMVKGTETKIRMNGKIAGVLLQLFISITLFRSTGKEKNAFIHWFKQFIEFNNESMKLEKLENKQKILNYLFPWISLTLIYLASAPFLSVLTTGQFLSFISAFSFFTNAMLELSFNLPFIVLVVIIYKGFKPILDEVPEKTGKVRNPGKLKGVIEASHVSFRYKSEGKLILDDVSFKIPEGGYVAFVGPSGCGKSTIMNLLIGFYKPQTGTIYYDNQDMKDLDPTLVRRQIGVVLQSGHIISDDIYTNIIGLSPQLTINDAWEALRIAALDKEVQNMPMGLFTILTSDGSTLSEGQKQRLMIARALVHKPKIIIFDEATSALDNISQKVISDNLDQLKVTRIVVAHRLSTIVNAHVIYYLENGSIREFGTYEQLLAQKGLFFQFAERQLV